MNLKNVRLVKKNQDFLKMKNKHQMDYIIRLGVKQIIKSKFVPPLTKHVAIIADIAQKCPTSASAARATLIS